MKSKHLGWALCASGLVCGAAGAADIMGVQEDYNLFGHLENDGPLCAPTATANSFAYLQNRYPGIYGQKLVGPPADLSEVRDALASDMGISRDGTDGPSMEAWWKAKVGWFDQQGLAGTTVFKGQDAFSFDTSQFEDSQDIQQNTKPTWDFLLQELRDGEDVEITISGYEYQTNPDGTLKKNADGNPILKTDTNGDPISFAHALTLTSLHWDDEEVPAGTWDPGVEPATIDYLDPNNPTQLFETPLTYDITSGYLRFDWENAGANDPSPGVFITAAYSESPVLPEPMTLGVVVVGGMVLGLRRRRA